MPEILHQHLSKLKPRHFLWAHRYSSICSCQALKLYLVRFLRRDDWRTVRGMTALRGWPGCDVRVSQGAEGNIGALAQLWRVRVHRWAWSQIGNVTPVQSWDKTSALSLKLVHSSHCWPSHDKTEWNMSGLVVSSMSSFSRPAARWTSFPLFTLVSFHHWILMSFGSCIILLCE